MGKATDQPKSQLHYLQHRVKLLQNVLEQMEKSELEKSDWEQVVRMLEMLTMKAKRYQQDCEQRTSKK
ncbi:hypothetical protein RZN22_03875 [Bacillaceae bacterium S4-13-58]